MFHSGLTSCPIQSMLMLHRQVLLTMPLPKLPDFDRSLIASAGDSARLQSHHLGSAGFAPWHSHCWFGALREVQALGVNCSAFANSKTSNHQATGRFIESLPEPRMLTVWCWSCSVGHLALAMELNGVWKPSLHKLLMHENTVSVLLCRLEYRL